MKHRTKGKFASKSGVEVPEAPNARIGSTKHEKYLETLAEAALSHQPAGKDVLRTFNEQHMSKLPREAIPRLATFMGLRTQGKTPFEMRGAILAKLKTRAGSTPQEVTPANGRALSIRQPFAERILTGAKKIEYRSKVTHIRGEVYVYACKARSCPEDYEDAGLNPEKLPHGMLVGTVEIVDCVQGDDGYEWHLANPKRLKTPLAVTGVPQPGFFWPFGR